MTISDGKLNIVVDVESDGPCPGLYSMISFGAVVLEDPSKSFFGQTAPISDKWIPQALAVSEITRQTHCWYPNPSITMQKFKEWLDSLGGYKYTFWSDNPAFDWQFINYYCWKYLEHNPFGFSARRIGDLYAGYKLDVNDHTTWKKLRDTRHTHNPVDDARGNAEALNKIVAAIKRESK